MTSPHEDPACEVAHGTIEPTISAQKALVVVFATPVAGFLLRYAADAGYQTVLIEPDPERAAAVEPDPRTVLAPALNGFAAGTADAYSDIDLNCAITDESADWFTAHWGELARQITPLVLAGPVPGALGGYTPGNTWTCFTTSPTSPVTSRPASRAI